MDDRTKELAREYMKTAAGRIPHSEKLPVKLPESREMLAAVLLGHYGAQVESRGMELVMDDATVSKVEKVVKWMYDSPKRGLLLCGTLGNGKTTMLKALKSLFIAKATYYEALSLYDYFKQNQCFPDIPQDNVLLVDDLGVEPVSCNNFGEIRYPLVELLMKRYKSNLATVIATNRTFEEIGEIYGARLQDRMREMYATIRYIEPSYRK